METAEAFADEVSQVAESECPCADCLLPLLLKRDADVELSAKASVLAELEQLARTSAYVGHREQPYRRIVITRIGHRDRSEATLVGGWSGGGFGLALSA